jgi:hypothetical protein
MLMMKEQLQKLNLEIEKLRETASVYGGYTTEYRECLEKEIELLKEQKKLVDAEIKNIL